MRRGAWMLAVLVGCGPAISEGESTDDSGPPQVGTTTDDTTDTEPPSGTVTADTLPDTETDSAADVTTDGPVVDLGPCANISGCLTEQGLSNQDLIDRYGPTGTCWQDFPAPTCWVQCAAWLESVAPECESDSACCSCATSDDCIWDPTAPTCDGGHCSGAAPTCDTISFATDVQPILDANCIECHAPGGQWPSLDMSVDAYADLVDVDGIQTMALIDFKLVVPGQPELSYILYKLDGTMEKIAGAAAGAQMPLGNAPIDPALRETVGTWIECGAPP